MLVQTSDDNSIILPIKLNIITGKPIKRGKVIGQDDKHYVHMLTSFVLCELLCNGLEKNQLNP